MTLGMKKRIISISGIFLFSAAAAGIGTYYNTPVDTIAIDVNPSIELQTNPFGDVISINAVNSDAKKILEGYQLKKKELDEVIEDVINRMILNGYLLSEDTNEILISMDDKASDELRFKVNYTVNKYLKEKELDVAVIDQTVNMSPENIQTAHANNVSVGKMAVIDNLTQSNDNLSVDQLADDSIKQLMEYTDNQSAEGDQIVTEDNADNGSFIAATFDNNQNAENATENNQIDANTSTSNDPVAIDIPAENNKIVISAEPKKESSVIKSTKTVEKPTISVDAVSSATTQAPKKKTHKSNSSNTSNTGDAMGIVVNDTTDSNYSGEYGDDYESEEDYEDDSEDSYYEDGEDEDRYEERDSEYEESDDYEHEDNEHNGEEYEDD